MFSALASKDLYLVSLQWLLLGGVAVVLGSGVVGWGVARLFGLPSATFVPPMMFNNSGNMGLPLAVLAFGAPSLAPAAALFIVSNTFHFTLGTALVSGKVNWRGAFLSPIILATLAGAAVSVLQLSIPGVVITPLKMLGDASIPLMLFALGNRMTGVSRRGWQIGLLGAAVCPLAGLLVASAVALYLPLDNTQRGLLFLFAALPPAVMNYVLAEQYRQQPEQVASIVLIGNVAALLFVPLGLWLGGI